MGWLGWEQIHGLGIVRYLRGCGSVTWGNSRMMELLPKGADSFAKWKVDYIKLDGCNVKVEGQTTEEHTDTRTRHSATRFSYRPQDGVFSVRARYLRKRPTIGTGGLNGSKYGNLWREGRGIALGQEPGTTSGSASITITFKLPAWEVCRSRALERSGLLAGRPERPSNDEMQSRMSLWR